MSQPTLRANPAEISATLKEAVVDSLLNLTYAQLSGQGEAGEYLYGARPRTLLNSGFLLPQRNPLGDDEVTSPIWVSSHGLQMQLNLSESSIITVQPNLCVYVRVLPQEEDLTKPNCCPVFMLRRAIVDEITAERNRQLEKAWEEVKGAYTSKWKHPEWGTIRSQIVEEIYTARGIPRHLLTSDFSQDFVEVEVEVESSSEKDIPGEGAKEGIFVKVGETLPIKDEHFEPLSVPHKWMRLDVSLPPLQIDTSKSYETLKSNIAEHAILMNATLSARLQEWAKSDDPNVGGKNWGYRHLVNIPASQYTKWDDFLNIVRNSKLHIALPSIQLSWNFELNEDWLTSSKRSFFLALENTVVV